MNEDNSHPGITVTTFTAQDQPHHQVWVNGPDDEGYCGHSVSWNVYSEDEKDWSVDVRFERDGEESVLVIPWAIAVDIRDQMYWMERAL